MKTVFVVLTEKNEGFAFPAYWSGITPSTHPTKECAEKFSLDFDEWVEQMEVLPNGGLKRSNGEVFTHDSIGRAFTK